MNSMKLSNAFDPKASAVCVSWSTSVLVKPRLEQEQRAVERAGLGVGLGQLTFDGPVFLRHLVELLEGEQSLDKRGDPPIKPLGRRGRHAAHVRFAVAAHVDDQPQAIGAARKRLGGAEADRAKGLAAGFVAKTLAHHLGQHRQQLEMVKRQVEGQQGFEPVDQSRARDVRGVCHQPQNVVGHQIGLADAHGRNIGRRIARVLAVFGPAAPAQDRLGLDVGLQTGIARARSRGRRIGAPTLLGRRKEKAPQGAQRGQAPAAAGVGEHAVDLLRAAVIAARLAVAKLVCVAVQRPRRGHSLRRPAAVDDVDQIGLDPSARRAVACVEPVEPLRLA